jgi:glutamyl-tRNA synthetase
MRLIFHHRDRGFIPEGLLNYLALLGWGISADRDIFSLTELAENFDVVNVNPNPARFDQKKADSINASHIRLLEAADFESRLIPFLQRAGLVGNTLTLREQVVLSAAAPLIQERIVVLSESEAMLDFLFKTADQIIIEADALDGLPENTIEVLAAAAEVLEGIEDFTTANIQDALNAKLIEELQLKPRLAFGPLRTAISGRRISPPLFESMEILGKQETIERLKAFARTLGSK